MWNVTPSRCRRRAGTAADAGIDGAAGGAAIILKTAIERSSRWAAIVDAVCGYLWRVELDGMGCIVICVPLGVCGWSARLVLRATLLVGRSTAAGVQATGFMLRHEPPPAVEGVVLRQMKPPGRGTASGSGADTHTHRGVTTCLDYATATVRDWTPDAHYRRVTRSKILKFKVA